ncbi:hypothetical protein CS063_12010 [Sporanaerobium hydrogeniformans]|uniref:Uncharacterized protein n=1 Tax=Sporanaerobium hydrogeniformans TaxID=3072179 RepID=A0AC61DBR6_9FIRM|nr:hypothetical protein [Sporanaerobium hydrogeniformans]PHV70196.1 hypothetical protein CS063_12010 [Sporanaerobium hydrogeniformans]
MKASVVKIIGLIALSLLCIIQISMLWLGDMSSPNFLEIKNISRDEVGMRPKGIWANLGLAYKISENNREYHYLMHELFSGIRNEKASLKIEKNVDMTYEMLMRMQGIVYEYAVALTLEELVGNPLEKYDKSIITDCLFVDISTSSENKVNVYLINSATNEISKMVLHQTLEGHKKMIATLSEQAAVSDWTVYQPSSTSDRKQYLTNNVFLPLISKASPLYYEQLTISNNLEKMEEKEKLEQLEEYVTSFFTNPLLKQIDKKEDGTILFSENLRAIVKYNPIGTMEFNILAPNEPNKLTKLERLQKVESFINDCSGIPEYLKKGIYLAQAWQEGEDYIYRFNYKYNGFNLQFREEARKELEINSVIELTLRSNQVIKGKWILLDIQPSERAEAKGSSVTRGYGEIIDLMYTLGGQMKENNMQLTNLECNYIVNQLEGNLKMDWVVTYGNGRYYP